jgi:hypothetical protein
MAKAWDDDVKMVQLEITGARTLQGRHGDMTASGLDD